MISANGEKKVEMCGWHLTGAWPSLAELGADKPE